MADDDSAVPLLVERDGAIATITFNRPHRKNAIDGEVWDRLDAAVQAIRGDATVRAVVLTGAGGEFCSGADLTGLGDGGGHPLAAMRRVGDIVLALHRLPQPTIAKVRGIAAGIGLNLALVCDLVVAGEGARFSEIFARRGLSIDGGGSWSLPRIVGMQRAKEMVLFGDIWSAADAAEIGLVNRVVPDADLDEFVAGWAGRLAAGPPIALAMSKRLLNNAFHVTLEQALDDEALSQTVSFGTDDTLEALGAFLEKREPVFRGS